MKKITLVFILMAITFVLNAQGERKTYKGTYGEDKNWTAEYTYYDNPEGGRIYDGPFIQQRYNYYKKGNFVNNKQHGYWVMFYPYPGTVADCYLEVEFDNGMIHGPVLYQYKDGDKVLQEIKANVRNGVFDGTFEFKDTDFYTTGNIKDNLPTGKWVKKGEDNTIIIEIKQIGFNKYEINRFVEDLQTGDINKSGSQVVTREHLWSNITDGMRILDDKLKENKMRDSRIPKVPGM